MKQLHSAFMIKVYHFLKYQAKTPYITGLSPKFDIYSIFCYTFYQRLVYIN